MDLNAILAKARKKKLETEEADRKKRTDEMRAELDDLSRKAKSAEIQNNTYQKDRMETQKKLGELIALREYLAPQEYEEAESSVMKDLNELEERLQSHKALMDVLERQISSMQVAISSVSNTRTLTSESFSDDHILSAYSKSRPSIQQAYDEVKSLKDLLVSCGRDLKLINCHCRIAAGNLRILQDEIDPPPSPAEQMVLRRSFGTVGSLVKEYMCGIISALGRDRKEDWPQFVNQARLERDKILTEKNAVLRANLNSAEKVKREEPKEEPKEPQIEVPFEAINRVKDRKLVFFGGDKEVPLLVDFAKDVLMAKRVTWYESKKNDYDALMTSISAGGPDIVVMLNLWSSHKFSSPIIAACKKKGIPFVELLSSSREALRDQLVSNKGVMEVA